MDAVSIGGLLLLAVATAGAGGATGASLLNEHEAAIGLAVGSVACAAGGVVMLTFGGKDNRRAKLTVGVRW